MPGDFRFGEVAKPPQNPFSEVRSTGASNALTGVANAITARLNARSMAQAAETAAIAHAHEVMHTNETNIRIEAMKNEATLTDNAAQREHEAKMERERRATIRTEGLVERQKIASRAVAEQGAAMVLTDFAERNADKGHTVDITHSVDKGTRIQLTPASAREPESEEEL
jgi:hypothetical protein